MIQSFVIGVNKPKMTRRNIGIFRIPRKIILENPEHTAEIFGFMKCVPVMVDIDFDFNEDTIRYKAISEIFPAVEEGLMTPEYYIQVTVGERKEITSVKAVPLDSKINVDKRSLVF